MIAMGDDMSTIYCGCDKEAGYKCTRHKMVATGLQAAESLLSNDEEADVNDYKADPLLRFEQHPDRTIPFMGGSAKWVEENEAAPKSWLETVNSEPAPLSPERRYEYHPVTSTGVTTTVPFGAEIRVTDPTTGGQKGSKLQRFSLIPSEFLWALAEHYGVGARKYDDRNWERGYKWSLSQDAHDRHVHQWLQGEDRDVETNSHHLISAAWHLVALFIFQLRGLGTDDIRRKS